ncbi:exostosin family protein [Altericista sp. CCNU0014]|uniref:exostosin domain-containing protein n=1 Tax=Altericista sp. CCNU0014 TaxID=3082949 RepID=UPI00384FF3AB
MSKSSNSPETANLRQLNIYTDPTYLPEGIPHIFFLSGFWGKNSEDISNPKTRCYDEYIKISSDFLNMVRVEDAQLAILPFDWFQGKDHPQGLEFARNMAQKAALQGIPLVIFCLDDATTAIDLENSLVFRTSSNRSSRQQNEIVIPAWSEDFVEHYCHGRVQLRSKSSRPVIGYCGYTALVKPRNHLTNHLRLKLGALPGMARIVKKVGIELVKHPLPWLYGSRIRSQALFVLSKTPKVECNFLIRDSLHHTEKLTLSQREQFVENMLNSDYILCTRGGGNFSYRFYETLSCGRIPVFVNTDSELPFERWIDWKRYCVWVEEDDLPYLGERIREFHARLTPQQFQELQIECRKLWVEWLSPQGFLRNFYRHFES